MLEDTIKEFCNSEFIKQGENCIGCGKPKIIIKEDEYCPTCELQKAANSEKKVIKNASVKIVAHIEKQKFERKFAIQNKNKKF